MRRRSGSWRGPSRTPGPSADLPEDPVERHARAREEAERVVADYEADLEARRANSFWGQVRLMEQLVTERRLLELEELRERRREMERRRALGAKAAHPQPAVGRHLGDKDAEVLVQRAFRRLCQQPPEEAARFVVDWEAELDGRYPANVAAELKQRLRTLREMAG